MRLALGLAVLMTGPVAAQDCRLALLLAVDVSRSISLADYAVQQDGLLAALDDPAIRAALFGPGDPVALSVFEWSGRTDQRLLADWTLIRTPDDLAGLAAAVAAGRLDANRQATALGRALEFALTQLDGAPPCAARVLDVSGDGQNNEGIKPADIYARGGWDGVRVNGLAIGEHEAGLVDYYRTQVIRGAGAFVEVAPRQTDFPAAIRRKLLRELAPVMLGQGGRPDEVRLTAIPLDFPGAVP
jgi:Protein of unknown function (DUF1194)